MTNLVGKIVDQKYRLIRLLGEGGMGAVYEAEHVLLHSKVALKVIKDEYASIPEAFQRFLREAQAAGAIGHPNITKVHDFGEDDGLVYAVMELLRGKSLEALLQERGRLAPEPAVAIILQVLSALHAAHRAGIIHRDLKPDNVFICVDSRGREEVKLLDFGVAKFNRPENVGLGLTKTGAILGTPHYLAPEQARGKKNIDERIDIWSTGVMLYEVLSGRLPFDGNNYNEVLGSILLQNPEALVDTAPHVPPGLADVVHKALSKDRNERYACVTEMIDALMPFAGDDDEEGDSIITSPLPGGGSTTPLPNKPPRYDLPTESLSTVTPGPTYVGEGSSLGAAASNISRRPTTPVGPEIPTVTTMEAIASNTMAPPPTRPRKKSALRLSLAGAATGAALVAISLVVFYRPATSTAVRGDEATSLEENLTVLDAPPRPEAPQPASAKTADKITTAARAPDVSLTIEGLPDGARVYLGDTPITPRHNMSQSDTPVQLRVEADGYRTVERRVVMNRDVVIYLPMTLDEVPSPKTRSSSKKIRQPSGRGGKGPRGQGADQQWADNPFN